MAQTLYFYDLETSGVDPRNSRIMQFAGQRTDINLRPVDEPHNILIKQTDDILPDPGAVLITGITPQMTLADGVTEAEFVKFFDQEINKPDTIFVGFNSIRFDDEFMRFLFWRNFHDSYEWQWKDGNSRWDVLDLSRMTRALRPQGIKWPVDSKGKPTNRLEFLTSVNKISHADAHDALADVKATIAVANLIKKNQPKIFNYLLNLRTKKEVEKFLNQNDIFIYSSGKYPGEFDKTTVVANLGKHPDNNGVLVYDLRHEPAEFIDLKPKEIAELWQYDREKKLVPLPVKSLQPNRCPAVAPLGVLDAAAQKRLKIDLDQIKKNHKALLDNPEFIGKLHDGLEILNKKRAEQTSLISEDGDVDSALYDNFVDNQDRRLLEKVRSSDPEDMNDIAGSFKDARLKRLLPLYKARNYPKSLSDEELVSWENFRKEKLLGGGKNSRFAQFSEQLSRYAVGEFGTLSDKDKYLLEELRLYAESILPES
ncbi:exodeoxyribonuclease I [Candidatus Saccharibacteria bacterium]|nr:exodeoxyribonuclease I [Candidatus Saccharibacteria bacterium]